MRSKLALQKHAESALSISDKLAVAGCLAPATYFLDVSSLNPGTQVIARLSPVLLIGAAFALRILALRAFDALSEHY
jgi:hypothetical protein